MSSLLLLNSSDDTTCGRCNARIHRRSIQSIYQCIALLVTAVILYIPANLYPIMTTRSFGISSTNTIISGAIVFWRQGDYLVSSIIFIASVFIPAIKILALSYLCYAVLNNRPISVLKKSILYRYTELIGRWSMIDVFVVALLVALVQLGNIMAIKPGLGALCFATVVIITMLAAIKFDPRLLWDKEERLRG